MRTLLPKIKFVFILTFFFALAPNANGQILKKLAKRAEKAAERTVERRVEEEASKKTDQALDSILEPSKKGQQKSPVPQRENPSDADENESNSKSGGTPPQSGTSNPSGASGGSKAIEIYRKFDFVPGNEVLLFDDFTDDFVGDFPSKWNTNGGGELVEINNSASKWLRILPGFGTQYIPDVVELPEEFTMEFDVIAQGLDEKTSSQSYFQIMVGDTKSFEKPKNYGFVEYPLCQFIDPGIIIENNSNGKREIRNDVKADIRKIVTKQHHISLAINKQRFRFWINEQKVVDVPRLLPANVTMQAIKLHLRGIDINKESVYLSNFKIAKGGVDLRRKLISEGKISTNGILFNSGSDEIQPQSMGIIRQMYQVLQQEKDMNLKIIGHTDSDGGDDINLKLSKKRAESIKRTLVDVYGVAPDRLQTEGKGESEPIGNNSTAAGKAQNRRVEFIRQ